MFVAGIIIFVFVKMISGKLPSWLRVINMCFCMSNVSITFMSCDLDFALFLKQVCCHLRLQYFHL